MRVRPFAVMLKMTSGKKRFALAFAVRHATGSSHCSHLASKVVGLGALPEIPELHQR